MGREAGSHNDFQLGAEGVLSVRPVVKELNEKMKERGETWMNKEGKESYQRCMYLG